VLLEPLAAVGVINRSELCASNSRQSLWLEGTKLANKRDGDLRNSDERFSAMRRCVRFCDSVVTLFADWGPVVCGLDGNLCSHACH
jgi:hypothetical protein